jgi:hypothetical protein
VLALGHIAFTVEQGVARHATAVRSTEFLVAVPAPVLPQPSKEAAQSFDAGVLPDHQNGRSAFGTFHGH